MVIFFIMQRLFLRKESNMGKDLKGKELGVGLTQRKDGLYQARYKDRFGKEKFIYDKKLSEVRRKQAIAISEN